MRWFKPGLRNSISALLGADTRTDSPESLEPVRMAMLDMLGEDGAKINPRLKHRLLYVNDAHALWYARADMVAVLSSLHGEAKAVDLVQALSPVFSGLIPKSLMESCRARR
jgi:hypothetical protein